VCQPGHYARTGSNVKVCIHFPFATFIVNMLGSFILGAVIGFELSALLSLLVATGFLGSFTTFSTFHVENIELLWKKKYWHLLSYLGGSTVFGMFLFLLGIVLGNRI